MQIVLLENIKMKNLKGALQIAKKRFGKFRYAQYFLDQDKSILQEKMNS